MEHFHGVLHFLAYWEVIFQNSSLVNNERNSKTSLDYNEICFVTQGVRECKTYLV